MNAILIKKWDTHRDKLREYISTHLDELDTYSYLDLFKMMLKIWNEDATWEDDKFNTEDIVVADFGSYSGIITFVFHCGGQYPVSSEVFVTAITYGSCDYCDTLKSIQAKSWYITETEGKTNARIREEQIEEYMTLCLHMVQLAHDVRGE